MPPYNIDIGGGGGSTYRYSHNNRYTNAPAMQGGSGSWASELFPRSHPRHRPSGASLDGGSSSIHPHIRGVVERQRKIKELQRQVDNARNNVKELYYPSKEESDNNNTNNVIHGLHMDHVLNDHCHFEDGASLLQSDRGGGGGGGHQPYTNHPLSPHLNQGIHRRDPNYSEGGDYEIEGTFQSKGCVNQTADDVGYLFGCGTAPQDEVVYVYNTSKPKAEGPPTGVADERNLFYHQGPSNNVNDVLFHIDKEYQAMQAQAGDNNTLRDPHPHHHRAPPAPNGHYHVVYEDDEYTKKSSCSIASVVDLLLPGMRKNKQSRSSTPILSPRKQNFVADYDDRTNSRYPILCASPRKRRNKHSAYVSTSESEDNSTFDKMNYKWIKKTASDSVHELQSQLKAMVNERAKAKVSPKNSEKEERQEPSPPASPKPSSVDKDVDKLRQEQATLDQARKLLQEELAKLPAASGYGMGVPHQQQQPMAMVSPLGMNQGSMGGVMTNGMWPQQQQQQQHPMPMSNGMMGLQQSGINMVQHTPMSFQQTTGLLSPQVPSNAGYSNNDIKPRMSQSIFTGGPNGSKFIDNVGVGITRSYSTRHQQQPSPFKTSPPHARISPPTRSYSNNEFTQDSSNQRLSDLKSKNDMIRKDISRMKQCMSSGAAGGSTLGNNNTPIKGMGSTTRPFPRTSPPSSPKRQERDDIIAKAMQRSDEARSMLSSSTNSNSGRRQQPPHPQGYYRSNQYRGNGQRYEDGRSRHANTRPSPIETSKQRNQEYFYV